MKTLNVNVPIVKLYPIRNADGTNITRGANKRVITHRMVVAGTPAMDEAYNLVAKIKRATHAPDGTEIPGGEKPASLAAKRPDGTYAIDLSAQQVGLLTAGRFNEGMLSFIAPKCTVAMEIQIREIGEVVFDRQLGKDRDINQGHAVIQGLTLGLPQGALSPLEMQLLELQLKSGADAAVPIVNQAKAGVTSGQIAAVMHRDTSGIAEDDRVVVGSSGAPQTNPRVVRVDESTEGQEEADAEAASKRGKHTGNN